MSEEGAQFEIAEDDDTDGDDAQVPESNEYENVVDESGTVNKKHKEAIIQARNRIDEREDAMFTGPLIDPSIGQGMTHRERVKAMGRTVRMLLRRLRPLLVRDTVEGAAEYAEGVPLGTVTLVPPETDGIPFGELAYGDVSERAFRREYGIPRETELPRPVKKEYEGLLSVLMGEEEVTHTWRVKMKRGNNLTPDDVLDVQAAKPIPMHVLENAVMAADDFMQEAGIGIQLDTGDPVGAT